jgi:2-polyprenyl-6-methoxyphenol hydroxylase-like FAD-dependent oxidoreductase
MSSYLGKQALVVGAGMGGLTAARVLSDHFEQVLVLERDELPSVPQARTGVPQGRHVHVLLAGGQHALCTLFPGFETDLDQTGAVVLRVGLDNRIERPGDEAIPPRDLGLRAYAISRPQLELSVRHRVQSLANVELHPRCRVRRFVSRSDGTAVTGLEYTQAGGQQERLEADLIVDASGRGVLTLEALESMGYGLPEMTRIGVDMGYASTVFAIPDEVPSDWKSVFTFPKPPGTSRGGLLMPMEGHRWILSVGGRQEDKPPGNVAGFMTYVEHLQTRTIFEAIAPAKRLSDIVCFGFSESIYRHYHKLPSFPRGLLPLGDALCRFNPVYGQGMSVAAQEAQALADLLAARASASAPVPDPLQDLAASFFAAADAIIDTPWAMAAIPDFIFPGTQGERPTDFAQRLQHAQALSKLAALDPAVQKLNAEVAHLLKPRSVYQEPELKARLEEMMAAS